MSVRRHTMVVPPAAPPLPIIGPSTSEMRAPERVLYGRMVRSPEQDRLLAAFADAAISYRAWAAAPPEPSKVARPWSTWSHDQGSAYTLGVEEEEEEEVMIVDPERGWALSPAINEVLDVWPEETREHVSSEDMVVDLAGTSTRDERDVA